MLFRRNLRDFHDIMKKTNLASMSWLVTLLENEREYHGLKVSVVIDEIEMKYGNIFKPHTTGILRCV